MSLCARSTDLTLELPPDPALYLCGSAEQTAAPKTGVLQSWAFFLQSSSSFQVKASLGTSASGLLAHMSMYQAAPG